MDIDLEETLKERGARYGDFTDNAWLAQALKGIIRQGAGYGRLRPVHKEALDQICSKMSRIVTASPEYRDNWDDIAGYATITSKRCL